MDLENIKKVFHLSHTDLDGYSCQLISGRVFSDIEFFNSNYGDEISQKLSHIVSRASQGDMVLITDLNLNMDDAKFIDEKSQEIGFKLLLLDHHKTGEDCARVYDWYNLDVNRSATKITYDFFSSYHDISDMDEYVASVNAYDIWLQEQSERFEIGKVLARYVMSARELNRVMFSDESFLYITHLLKEGTKELGVDKAQIALDDNLHRLKKEFFVDGQDDTLENLVSKYVVKLLTKNKDDMTIYIDGYKGILTFGVGNTSIIGNSFLTLNDDYDFFFDLNSRKNIGMRANNKCDVSQLAKKYFGGGGHANASGGRFQEFKDSFLYHDIKEQVETFIETKKV